MIMLLPWGSVLCSITEHIPDHSAATTGENKVAAAKGRRVQLLLPPFQINDSSDLARGNAIQTEITEGEADGVSDEADLGKTFTVCLFLICWANIKNC